MRLLTRSDFDGLMCAVLLKELDIFDERKFVHPKDIQDGLVEVNEEDILVNVPFAPGCGMWFDHHTSEEERGLMNAYSFKGTAWPAPSCARVVYEFYGGDQGALARLKDVVAMADKCDAAQFTREEILAPTGWVLLSFLMDPRTGLGRYRDYRISNYQLMDELVDYLRAHPIEEILALSDVQERVQRYFEQEALFRDMLLAHSWTRGNAIVTDLRGIPETFVGNRHVIYALFPEQNISIRIFDGKDKAFCVFSVGHSILNRTSQTNVGALMLAHGGGGHPRVGTCQVPYVDADRILEDMLALINHDG